VEIGGEVVGSSENKEKAPHSSPLVPMNFPITCVMVGFGSKGRPKLLGTPASSQAKDWKYKPLPSSKFSSSLSHRPRFLHPLSLFHCCTPFIQIFLFRFPINPTLVCIMCQMDTLSPESSVQAMSTSFRSGQDLTAPEHPLQVKEDPDIRMASQSATSVATSFQNPDAKQTNLSFNTSMSGAERQTLSNIWETVSEWDGQLRTEVCKLRGEFNELRGEFNELRNGIRGEFNELRGEFNELRGQFNELRNGIRGEFVTLFSMMESMSGNVKLLMRVNGIN
jgi:hypothetical protein